MDTRMDAKDYRLSHWAQIIQARLESGKTIKDFCESEGINKYTYFYWQKKLRQTGVELAKTKEPKSDAPNGWVRLSPKQPQCSAESLNIEINGCHVNVSESTDIRLLRKVCHMLRSL